MRKASKNSLKCNDEQDSLVYFTFYPLVIFCFFLASDKFFLIDDLSLYNNNVVIAITVCQVLTHEFCINVIFISVYEVFVSNFDKTHTLCRRPRVLEVNSILAIMSITALSLISTFGALVKPDDDEEYVDLSQTALVSIPFWIFSKLVLILSMCYLFKNSSSKS